jgi:hypothetical protein
VHVEFLSAFFLHFIQRLHNYSKLFLHCLHCFTLCLLLESLCLLCLSATTA